MSEYPHSNFTYLELSYSKDNIIFQMSGSGYSWTEIARSEQVKPYSKWQLRLLESLHLSPDDIGLTLHWEVHSILVADSCRIQMGENSCFKNLDNILYFLTVTLNSLFPICTTWKIIHFNLNCTYTPKPNPPLLLSPKYVSPYLSVAAALWISDLARAVSLIISPWITHYWATSTQETAGNSQLASLGITEQICSYRLDKLIHLKAWSFGW